MKDELRNTPYVIALDAQPSVPVVGSEQRFPVGRIYCVGRNYADHAREMGHDPDREPPFFFMKPAEFHRPERRDALVPASGPRTCTTRSRWWWRWAPAGRHPRSTRRSSHVYGYGVGLDMTRRDIQGEAKKAGRPWEMGKAFDQSAPCTALQPAAKIGHPGKGAIWLKVNGVEKQKGDLAQQIWDVRRTDFLPVEPDHARPRRPHLFRHARRRGPGEGRRPARRPCRRGRRPHDPLRLTTTQRRPR